MKTLSVFLIGCVFSLGLCISGLFDPNKVLAFLDLFGAWDPSLIFTMGGGLIVAGLSRFATRRRGESLLFGTGWGLAGVCPGPAIVNLGFLSAPATAFAAAMLAGMALYETVDRLQNAQPSVTVDA